VRHLRDAFVGRNVGFRASNTGRPVIDIDFSQGEIADVCGGDRSTNSERGSCDQTVGLVERHSSVCELTSPSAGADPLGSAQGCDPQTVEQAPGYWFFYLTQASPDLLD